MLRFIKPSVIICRLVLIFLLAISAFQLAAQPLSIQPNVQTAKWAQSWWMPRHQAKLAEKNKMSKVELVFIGDSITHSWDDPNKGLAIWQKHFAPLNALNLGFSGDRTEHVLWRIQNGAIDGIDPKLLVLMIGTNNTGHRQDPAKETALGIKHILDLIQLKLPNTKILLLAIFPRGAFSDDPLRQLNDQVNHLIQDYHDGQHIFYKDINHLFLDQSGELSRIVMKDLLHPNKSQYQVWAKGMLPSIQQLMNMQ